MSAVMILSAQLKEIRKLKKKSVRQVVDEMKRKGILDISRDLLSKWENGKRKPDFDQLLALAQYYDVPTDYLLGRSPLPYSDDRAQLVASVLDLPDQAARNLLSGKFLRSGSAGQLFGDILSAPLLPDVMRELVASKNGISKQLHYCEKPVPDDFKAQCLDMADMYVVRSLRAMEKLLRYALGYNELEGK